MSRENPATFNASLFVTIWVAVIDIFLQLTRELNGACYEKGRLTKYRALLAGPLFFPWACTRASIPKVVGSIPTVAKHIFQACPVWIYTQSNITNIFT
jgi:hypothetical protein